MIPCSCMYRRLQCGTVWEGDSQLVIRDESGEVNRYIGTDSPISSYQLFASIFTDHLTWAQPDLPISDGYGSLLSVDASDTAAVPPAYGAIKNPRCTFGRLMRQCPAHSARGASFMNPQLLILNGCPAFSRLGYRQVFRENRTAHD